MIASWTGKIPAGVVSGHLSGFQDMFPTFLDLADTQGFPAVPEADATGLLEAERFMDENGCEHPISMVR